MRFLAPLCLLMMALGGLATDALAQHLPERTFAVASTVPFQEREIGTAAQGPRAWPYVVTGAVLGAVAMGAGIAIHMEQTNDEFLGSPFAFLPAIAAGAALGGGIGYVVYRIRL